MKHKWHKEIKAWADGAEIEAKWNVTQSGWFVDPIPRWNNDEWEYRIKPQPKEPQYLYVYRISQMGQTEYKLWDNKFTGGAYIGKIKLEVDDVPGNV
jgi:hypothetical protein